MVEKPSLDLCGRPVGVGGSVLKLDADEFALALEVAEATLSVLVARKSLLNQDGMCAGAGESKKVVN